MTEAVCGHCGESFSVARDLVGGITNCPRCGKATEVAGLDDIPWRLLQVAAAIGIAVAAAIGYAAGGVLVAVVVAVLAAGMVWLVSRAL